MGGLDKKMKRCHFDRVRVPEPRLGVLRRACRAGREHSRVGAPCRDSPPPRGGRDVSLEDCLRGELGRWAGAQDRSLGWHTGVGARAEMQEV